MGRRCAALAALLAAGGCTTQAAWQLPPLTINTAPPARYNALAPPPSALRPPERPASYPAETDRIAPFLLPPQRNYEPRGYVPEPEPPYSDGTPFSLDTPPAPDPAPAPYAPSVAETPPPARPTAPASAVPMVGFRPMR